MRNLTVRLRRATVLGLALLTIGLFGLYLQPVVAAVAIAAGGVVLQIRSGRVPRSGGRPVRR